jgi:hypothetical protein
MIPLNTIVLDPYSKSIQPTLRIIYQSCSLLQNFSAGNLETNGDVMGRCTSRTL